MFFFDSFIQSLRHYGHIEQLREKLHKMATASQTISVEIPVAKRFSELSSVIHQLCFTLDEIAAAVQTFMELETKNEVSLDIPTEVSNNIMFSREIKERTARFVNNFANDSLSIMTQGEVIYY